MDISSWVAHRASWSGAKAAVRFEGREITYRELEDQVAHLAGGLTGELGVRFGDRVAYLGHSSPELLELLFACARIGAILVPLNARMTVEQLRVILSNCQPRCIIVESPFRQHAESCLEGMEDVRFVAFSEASTRELDFPQLEPIVGQATPVRWNKELPLDAPVLIAYTSGTTGVPKGAVLTQEALFYSALNSAASYEMTSHDEVLTIFPMFHVGGMTVQTTPAIHAGATVNIVRQFEPGRALVEIENRRITLMVASPAMAEALTSHPNWNETDVSSLKCIALGAAIVTQEVIHPWVERAVPAVGIYGLTEALPPATAVPIDEARRKVGSIGLASIYYQARIVDGDMQDLGPGRHGEIVLSGPGVFKEYWANPVATQEVFTKDWFHTGDVGHIDEEGYFYIDDRMKDIVIVGASNVYPADLERILAECEAIAEAAVVGRPDSNTGERLVACIVLKEGQSLSVSQVKALFKGRLASYQHPHDVVFMDTLPRTAVGKVRKPELRQKLSTL